MLVSSLLEKAASIREGRSPGANARSIKRRQAGVSESRKKSVEPVSIGGKISKIGLKAHHSG